MPKTTSSAQRHRIIQREPAIFYGSTHLVVPNADFQGLSLFETSNAIETKLFLFLSLVHDHDEFSHVLTLPRMQGVLNEQSDQGSYCR